MIRSQMTSFRPQSNEQRNLLRYISLIEEIFAMIKQASSQSFSVNSIASSIRQIVLKHDCLEQKNDLLDFFFLCQKSINEQTVNQNKKNNKNWIKIIQSKINNIKGLQCLHQKLRKIQLKRGFQQLLIKQINAQNIIQTEIDCTTIEVEQDIKLKTLFFFKWCKFVQYGKTIKKLRLKQIDDLRKSLTFNMYAVKFSYFHNWRKQIKNNVSNRPKFNSIQIKSKQTIFKNTVNSFYSLYQIKNIEEKLVAKVKDALKYCKKQQFFLKLDFNTKKQVSKSINQVFQEKINKLKNSQAEKIKYRFLYYLSNSFQLQRIQSKTLSMNYIKSQQMYANLCAKTAFDSLKDNLIQIKQNISKIQEMRKIFTLQAQYLKFTQEKFAQQNYFNLSKFLRSNKINKGLNAIKLNLQIQKKLEEDLNISFEIELQNKNYSQCQINLDTSESIKQQIEKCDLFKYLEFKKLNKKLKQKMTFLKLKSNLIKLREFYFLRGQFQHKVKSTILMRQSSIFESLRKNHQRIQSLINRNNTMTKIYEKNLIKNTFNSIKKYKYIRLSHEQSLQNIEKKIINPNQLLTGFSKIYQRRCKIQACETIYDQVTRLTTKLVFKRCFSGYIQTLERVKNMQKRNQLKSLQLLFNLLKKNQQFNLNKVEQIKQNAISKLNKQFFINKIKKDHQHAQKYVNLYYYHLEERQCGFIKSLKERKQVILQKQLKQQQLQKYLGFSLLSKKILQETSRISQLEQKSQQLQKYLRQNQFDLFINSFNKLKYEQITFGQKQDLVQRLIINFKYSELIKKIRYERCHSKQIITKKVQKIYRQINYKLFYNKLIYESKNNYLKRWIDWKYKSNVYNKLQSNLQNINMKIKLSNTLKTYKIQNGFQLMKLNHFKQTEILNNKNQLLTQFINYKNKQSIQIINLKIISIKSTNHNYHHLIHSIKLKYLSKFMRNSLINKYSQIKQLCALKNYARNLKHKSFKGLTTMLLRLRDKQNKLKTQQEIIIKVDKALHHSRKSNKLSQTIQRFNSRRKSLSIQGPR